MKIIVQFSGGKDSLATLIYASKTYGIKNILAVFCDTGWEHELTYLHIKEVIKKVGVELVVLKSKKYKDFTDLAVKKKRFPSTKARFCTEELKTKPMIDFILDQKDNLIILQGIRSDESANRALMTKQCTYFRYYYEPYGKDKKGKDKYHTYRKKEIIIWRKEWSDDVIRPVFDWTAQQVIDYIISNGFKPNPLYYKGMSRVGCFPCIMCRKQEIKQISDFFPERVELLKENEKLVGRTFFPPNYIPEKFMTRVDEATGKKVPTIENVIDYVNRKDAQMNLLGEEKGDDRCMSFYGICE